MRRLLLLLLLLPLQVMAATVTDDTLTGTICSDGLVYVGSCPESGAADLTGTGYFVDGTSGSDTNNGLTPSTAWRSLDRVSTGIVGVVGPNVYLLSGTTILGKATINNSATEPNPTVVTCYYMDGTTPRECTTTHTRPVIQGQLTDACVSAYNCTYTDADYYVGQITVRSAHVQIRNFDCRLTRGPCIIATGSAVQYLQITDFSTTDTGSFGVLIESSGSYFVVKRFSVRYAQGCRAQYQTWRDARSQYPTATLPGATECHSFWGGGVTAANSTTYGLLEEGTISGFVGEAINHLRASKVIYRNLHVYDVYSGGWYSDAGSYGVLESSTFHWHQGGLLGRAPAQGTGATGGGNVSVGYEDIVAAGISGAGNVIRNNLVLEAGRCVAVGPESLGATSTTRRTDATVVFNTLLGCREYMTTVVNLNAANGSGQAVYNSNIIYGPGRPDCVATAPMAQYRANLFDRIPASAGCRGTSYTVGTPLFATTYSSLLGSTYSVQRDLDDVELLAGSPGRGSGDPAMVTQTCIAADTFPAWVTDKMEDPPVSDLACWRQCGCYDGKGRTRSTTAPHVGALDSP